MSGAEFKICLIEDDEIMGESMSLRFELEGYAYDWYRDGASAQQALWHRKYGAVVSDIRLPDMTGETLFSDLLEASANLPPFIFITGHGTIDQAVRLLKLGALDYIIKPFEMNILLEKLAQLRACPEGTPDKENALGISPAMRAIEGLLLKLAASTASVLITGESGVGKERVALKLHQLGDGAGQRPFIAVNCGALTETLLEAELFGYEKGAFTGAARTKKGVFEQADGGTLLLDEIGDMSATMQVKVLRAIQEKKIVRVGGETPVPVNIRLICATHRDLLGMVEQGKFREDLYYRINVIQIKIPPLRGRREDILWLARRILDEYAATNPGQKKILPPTAEQALTAHPWPGNVRELKHCLERACVLHSSPVLAPGMLFDKPHAPDEVDSMSEQQLGGYLAECERKYILRSLQSQNWSIQETANQIGISRKNLWEKMRKLGITRDLVGKQ
jgi:DNA-binding NtrC family response regulator